MIGLRELTAGIAEYLAAKTGIAATNRRAESPVYPWWWRQTAAARASLPAADRWSGRSPLQ